MRIKPILRQIAPHGAVRRWQGFRRYLALRREFRADLREYAALTGDHHTSSLAVERDATRLYHSIEKGLTLPAPRRPFALAVERRLRSLLGEHPRRSTDAGYVTYSRDALDALERWNGGGGACDLVAPQGAHRPSYDAELFGEFFASRRSVRNFDGQRPVEMATVWKAVKLALNTPSVCNRQAGRVHIFSDPVAIREILALQNGNRGFSDAIQMLAIVTVECGLFEGPGERNQRWIDGGLFAMTLVWALHAVGLSTCMLNWSQTHAATRELRRVACLPTDQNVVALAAIGHATEGYRVARSERRRPEEVCVVHGAAEQGPTDGHDRSYRVV